MIVYIIQINLIITNHSFLSIKFFVGNVSLSMVNELFIYLQVGTEPSVSEFGSHSIGVFHFCKNCKNSENALFKIANLALECRSYQALKT